MFIFRWHNYIMRKVFIDGDLHFKCSKKRLQSFICFFLIRCWIAGYSKIVISLANPKKILVVQFDLLRHLRLHTETSGWHLLFCMLNNIGCHEILFYKSAVIIFFVEIRRSITYQ